METFTDIEQSKKLSEILPQESADMYYNPYLNDENWYDIPNFGEADLNFNELPCWSLAALLSVIREAIGYTIYGVNNVYMSCDLGDKPWKLETEVYDNEIDACVEMIIKLHELKML